MNHSIEYLIIKLFEANEIINYETEGIIESINKLVLKYELDIVIDENSIILVSKNKIEENLKVIIGIKDVYNVNYASTWCTNEVKVFFVKFYSNKKIMAWYEKTLDYTKNIGIRIGHIEINDFENCPYFNEKTLLKLQNSNLVKLTKLALENQRKKKVYEL